MKPVAAIARYCALLVALSAVGCTSEDEPFDNVGGTGGSTLAKGGTSGSTAAPLAGGSGGAGSTTASLTSPTSAAGASTTLAGASSTQGGTSTTATDATAGVAGKGVNSGGGSGGVAGATVGAAGTAPLFSISGTVAGLVGPGLSLSLGTGNPLKTVATFSISGDGAFTAPLPIASGSNVIVGIVTQPSSPHQTCTVSASGTIPSLSGDIANIEVTCAVSSHAIGGTITGLTGNGLVLLNSTGDELAMGGNGRFAFPTKVLSGLPFTVTVKQQPKAPTQTCHVSGGSGTVGSADVTSVTVRCSTNSYTVGGTVVGLGGSGLALVNNGTDEVQLSANGTFAFTTPVLSGGPFAVTIKAQPSEPTQTCSLVSGMGTVANADVTTIGVNCTTNTYSVSGSVTGLVGKGLTLQNNLGDNVAVAADGSFVFATSLVSGTNYAVTVQTQPNSPAQDCTVLDGNGKISGSNVSAVKISCVTRKYSVGGTVTAMVGSGLVLRNNGKDDITLNSTGNFTFPTAVVSGEPFAATIQTQPNGEFCTLAGGSGTVGNADVASIRVNCSDKAFMIGGAVTGLSGAGLKLALNDKAPEAISNNGTFAFLDFLAKNDVYSVTITQQPTDPWQTCTLTNASGTVSTSNVSDIEVLCTTKAYTVGGNVSGLAAGAELVLQNNAGDNLTVTNNGPFAFLSSVFSGKPYAATILAQPTSPAQTCTVTQGGGTVGGANITNVSVTCTTNNYSISGTISGLVGSVVVANNTTDTQNLTSNGPFAFQIPVTSGNAYDVRVTSQPSSPAQICTVADGSGTVSNAAVTNVRLTCVTQRFTIGGTVTGLASGQEVVLQNNAGGDLRVAANGPFAFVDPIQSASTYVVSILSHPTAQTCTVSGGSGTVGSSNVTSIAVNCSTLHTIGGTVTGLSGTGLVLSNGTEDLPLSGLGTFAFKTTYLVGTGYDVTVRTQPSSPWQTCTVTDGKGTIGGDVSSVRIDCSSNQYFVNVNVTGIVGTGLILQNNNAENLSVSTNGLWPFASKLQSGGTYNVTVLAQPRAPNQTCTVSAPTGRIANADMTVDINCVSNNYRIGGTVSGYIGSGLVLRNNGADDLSISSTGTFTFTTPVASGTNYSVSIASHPSGFKCAVNSGTGTVGTSNVTSVRVTCPSYAFDGDIQGWTIQGTGSLSWTNSQGTPDAGALKLTTAAANCSTNDIRIDPTATISGTGKTLTLWVRFDAFPGSTPSGDLALYAQDSGWAWVPAWYPMSSFTLGVWRQLSLTLPASNNWSTIRRLGIQIPSGGGNCQTGTVFVDSVQLQ